MCGIVGYIGDKLAIPFLLEGLAGLEYRGYDSTGVAYIENGKLEVNKYKGRLKVLADNIEHMGITAKVGIGHTRWATHGQPSDENAHPHTNSQNNIAVIHNGIVENYVDIKEWLSSTGVEFKSETDTEVIAHLIDFFYDGDLLDAVYKAIEKMHGAYAIGVISSSEPDRIISVRKDSPLVIGLGKGENFIASDIPAILKHTRDVYLIENDEIVDVRKDSVVIYDEFKRVVKREIFKVNWDVESAEKSGYEHFTIKEIYEQPKAVGQTLERRLAENGTIHLEGVKITKEELSKIERISMSACGTAYHACLLGKRMFEKELGIPVSVEVASEFRYQDPIIDEKTLFITVSQSGETIDTLQALREAKRKKARVVSIVNVVGSSIARESDDVFYTWAGPEIGVASTKAFTTQIMAFHILAIYFANLRGNISESIYIEKIKELEKVKDLISETLKVKEQVQRIASLNFNKENVFFMGRGADVDIAFESSLKLKELSYINSFAIASGELKHGTIALIEESTLVIAFATQEFLFEKTLSNIMEVKARGAKVVVITKAGLNKAEDVADEIIYVPNAPDYLMPFLSVIPAQFLAYYVASLRNNDVDKPRNLAKSVTVE